MIPNEHTIHGYFEKQANYSGKSIALVDEKKSISYQDLSNLANKYANHLMENDFQNKKIGVLMEPSIDIVVVILAILKVGSCYVPLSSQLPDKRKEYIINDSELSVVVCDQLNANFGTDDVPTLLYTENTSVKDALSFKSTNHLADSEAYIIYTSGTTGVPKGVPIKHKSIMNTLFWRIHEYKMNSNIVQLQTFSFIFDGSISSLFSVLLSGGTVVIPTEKTKRNPETLINLIKYKKITHLFMIPTLFVSLLETKQVESFYSLKVVTLGGEKIPVSILKNPIVKDTSFEIVNEYGPTENSVTSTFSRNVTEGNVSSIGKPISNCDTVVVTESLAEATFGEIGELCVAGVGLTEGYLNNSTLNQEKFVIFDSKLFYKTGDLVRLDNLGNIIFIGRKDFQVKIRGYRIEIEEIEKYVTSFEKISEAVVIVQRFPKVGEVLIAYYSSEIEIEESEIKNFLNKSIPDYMIPLKFIKVNSFNTTPSGKINKSALPKIVSLIEHKQLIMPSSELEQQLIDIWRKIFGQEKIGVQDNFFSLGGHSLLIGSLLNEIDFQLKKQLTFEEVYSNPTIQEMAVLLSTKIVQKSSRLSPTSLLHYPLSPSQKGVYSYTQRRPESLAYNISMLFHFTKIYETTQIVDALNYLIEKYSCFRTRFDVIGDSIVQIVDAYKPIKYNIEENGNSERTLPEFLKSNIKPFNLKDDYSFRAKIFKLNNKQSLLIDTHHIVFDGISSTILQNDLAEFLRDKYKIEIDRLEFKDYIIEEKNTSIKKRQQDYTWWEKYLENGLPNTIIPLNDIPKSDSINTFKAEKIDFDIEENVFSDLSDIAGNDKSYSVIVLSAFIMLIQKQTNENELVIGIPFAGRNNKSIVNEIGMFVNTLPFKYNVNKEHNFKEIVQSINKLMMNLHDKQSIGPNDILEILSRKNKGISNNVLFDIVFSVQIESDGDKNDNFKFELVEPFDAKFPITFTIEKQGSSLKCAFEFEKNKYTSQQIKQIIENFRNLLLNITKKPLAPIKEIEMISHEKREEILSRNHVSGFKNDYTIHERFESIVNMFPNKNAIREQNKSVTYQELNFRAEKIANKLTSKGLHSEDFIGIHMDKSSEMLATMLAVLKIGCAYVPIDPKYPEDRKKYILKNSKLNWVISTENEELKLLNVSSPKENMNYPADFIKSKNNSKVESPAYVIYTSGSTGKPKGVVVNHKNVMSLLFPKKNNFDFSEKDCWTAFHSFCFDFSVWEIYGAILYGGTLVIVSDEIARNPKEFMNLLISEKVTVLNQTPSAFYTLIETEEPNTEYPYLKWVIFGGEALSPSKLKNWNKIHPHTKLINMYGITETTVHVTYKELTSETLNESISNIGKPINTLDYVVMDTNMNIVPAGVVGELYVRGHGVSMGYLNQPELTIERFIQNPIKPEETMYRSGDLVFETPYGELIYVGRIDDQIKIRGYRIELGEVEKVIQKIQSIKTCRVLVKEDNSGEKSIIVYYETNSADEIDLMYETKKLLPNYMIPSSFIKISNWPRTSNGKLDQKKLLKINQSDDSKFKNNIKASYDEIRLLELFKKVLNIDNILVTDNFFDIGGHSLRVPIIVTMINEEYSSNITFSEFYLAPCVKDLSALIREEKRTETSRIIKLKSSSDLYAKNMFLIHGGNARVNTYSEFSRNEHTGWNYLGIELFKNKLVDIEKLDCNKLAKVYVKLIKEKQPKGPYYIFGTCIGGTIAYEIALQLEKEYLENVHLSLASVEAPNINQRKITFNHFRKKYIEKVSNLFNYPEEITNTYEEHWEKIIDTLGKRKTHIHEICKTLEFSINNLESNSIRELFKSNNLTQSLTLLRDNYKPTEIFEGPVNYYNATEQELPSRYTWSHLCKDITYHDVSGNHDSIFYKENVTEFHNQIKYNFKLNSREKENDTI